jgi:plastocyanin
VRHTRTILVLLAAGALLAAGCASDDGGQEAPGAPAATAAPGTTASGGGATGGGGRGGYGRDYGDQSATTGGDSASGASGGVRIAGFAFAPKTVSARVGQKVTWENQDPSTIHTVTALDGSFRSWQLKQGGEFSHVFRRAGTFAYRCSIHPSMRGTVKVAG